VDVEWTLSELVAEATASIATLPPPKNGQVRAVPDERTVRYYGTMGLLDRPLAMRGRTALYGRKHLAQVVAIKRLQGAGRSLAEIREVWPTLDEPTLARMSGIELAGKGKATRKEFWKREPVASTPPPVSIPLVTLESGVSLTPADVRAIRAAAAALVAELARCGLIARVAGTLEETES
jgi:DNA-binding transcriptional MerR regulator